MERRVIIGRPAPGWRRRARRTGPAAPGARSATASRWRATVASSPRAIGPVSASCAPSRAQLSTAARTSGASIARSTPAVAARRLGGALERDEEVRGDGGGGVVGGAVLVGDLGGAHARRRRERPRRLERARGRARDRAAGAGEDVRGGVARHGHQGMQRERLVRGEHVEAVRARAVADEAAVARLDGGGRGGDLVVGDAEQHGGVRRRRGAAPERARHVAAGGAQRRGQREADASCADDGDRVQLSHEIPAAEGEEGGTLVRNGPLPGRVAATCSGA